MYLLPLHDIITCFNHESPTGVRFDNIYEPEHWRINERKYEFGKIYNKITRGAAEGY